MIRRLPRADRRRLQDSQPLHPSHPGRNPDRVAHRQRSAPDAERTQQFNPDLILMDMYMPIARASKSHASSASTASSSASRSSTVGETTSPAGRRHAPGRDHFLTTVQPVFLNTIVKSKIERYRALRARCTRQPDRPAQPLQRQEHAGCPAVRHRA